MATHKELKAGIEKAEKSFMIGETCKYQQTISSYEVNDVSIAVHRATECVNNAFMNRDTGIVWAIKSSSSLPKDKMFLIIYTWHCADCMSLFLARFAEELAKLGLNSHVHRAVAWPRELKDI